MLMMPWIAGLTRFRLPLGVILLVLANLVVYFGFQSRDARREQLAIEYYASGVLAELELPAYEKWLGEHGSQEALDGLHARQRVRALPAIVEMIEEDESFLAALRADRIIEEANPRYEDWQRARLHFDGMRARLFTRKYAFDTAHPTPLTAFSHQFLHGSNGHLFGNMLVLVLIAPAVEALLGTFVFLAIYVAGGFGAVGMYLMLATHAGSLVGASGAISAVMGAFAVLLGMRRIPLFVFAFVYFDIVRAPALLALPLWLTNEAAQYLWFSAGSNVAYSAHFGGLLAGALLALPWRRAALARLMPAEADVAAGKAPASPAEALALTLQQARRLMVAQRFEEARRAYLRAARDPACSLEGLREAVNLCRLTPAAVEYHQLVAIVCVGREGGAARLQLIRDCFKDYLKHAKPVPRLKPEILTGLIPRFVEAQCLSELESCLRVLCRLAPVPQPGLEQVLRQGIEALRAGGRQQPAAEIAALLRSAG